MGMRRSKRKGAGQLAPQPWNTTQYVTNIERNRSIAAKMMARHWVQEIWDDRVFNRPPQERPFIHPYNDEICPVCNMSEQEGLNFMIDMEDWLNHNGVDISGAGWDYGDDDDDDDDDGSGGGGGGGGGGNSSSSSGGGGSGFSITHPNDPCGMADEDTAHNRTIDEGEDLEIVRLPGPPTNVPPGMIDIGSSDSDSDFSASEEETSDEDEQAVEEAREERRKPLLSEIVMPSWENVVYDRAEWAAMLGRIDIQAQ